jgi:ethanolamine utilization protein EutN
MTNEGLDEVSSTFSFGFWSFGFDSSFVIRHSDFQRSWPMFLARVTGHVVATQKDKTLNGQKLFVVEPLNVKYDEATKQPASLGNTGRAIVAIDAVGAGEGQLVLIVQGSSARMTEQTKNLPADAVIVGIVDSAEFGGKTFYKTE